jgi:glycosyltransferase involved in cell wall biosynthesis
MYHLCILTSHFYPIKSSCSSLFKDLIKSLLRENFQITIMTISGTHNKVREINTKKIKYIGIKNPHLQSSHKYLRVVGDIIAIQKLRNFYNKKNFCEFDQVIVYSPSIFWGIILSKLKKKIVSIKLGDLYPKWLVDHKMISKFSLNFLFLKFFELLLYLQANKIYVQTKKDIQYISKYKKIFNFEIDVIYNWINTNSLPQKVKKNNKTKYVRFLFAGVISEAQNYNLLFKIIEYCRMNNLKSTFYFFGSGTKKKSLQKMTLSHKNVFFYNEKNINKLDQMIQKCDICMSTLTNNFYSENFPGKILRYMLNNKPMLVHSPNNNFLKELINNHSLGLFSSEEVDLYKNIDYIFSNFKSFQKKGSYGLNVVKNYYSCERAKEKFFKNI